MRKWFDYSIKFGKHLNKRAFGKNAQRTCELMKNQFYRDERRLMCEISAEELNCSGDYDDSHGPKRIRFLP